MVIIYRNFKSSQMNTGYFTVLPVTYGRSTVFSRSKTFRHCIMEGRRCSESGINTTGATSGAGTAHPSGAPEFTPVFSGVCVVRSLIFCVVFCRSSLFGLLFFLSFFHCVVCPS